MSNILEIAEKFYDVSFGAGNETRKAFFMGFVEEIVSELQIPLKLRQKIEENSIAVGEHLKKQGERIEALEKRVLKNLQKECELLYSLESRIKTLEESEKQNEYLQKGLIDLQSFKEWLQALEIKKPEPTVKENIPTDKDGKPEGGLKSNDLIRSILQEDYGLFACADGNKIWAVWKKGGYAWVDKSLVIFVYRPKPPEPIDSLRSLHEDC